MSKAKVIFMNKQTKIKIPAGIRMLLRRACNATLVHQSFDGQAEISVTFTDDEDIRKLNKAFRNIDKETDVLSFPLSDNEKYDLNPETGAKMLGDIVISVERAAEQAEEYAHSFEREMAFLTVHSTLHLLGFDHEEGGLPAAKMFETQENILKSLGILRGAQ